MVSPQQAPQSPGQLAQVSSASQVVLPHVSSVHVPQSCGQVEQLSLAAWQSPSPQTGAGTASGSGSASAAASIVRFFGRFRLTQRPSSQL
jgi:hypothetical protein